MSRYQPQTDVLRQHLKEIGDYPEGELEGLIKAATPHLIVAYKEGRMKATAGIGRRLVQKNLELSRKLRQIREAAQEGDVKDVLLILGEDEGPTTAEQEVRAKALGEAADAALKLDYYEQRAEFYFDSQKDAWDGGTLDVAGVLRRMANEAKGGA